MSTAGGPSSEPVRFGVIGLNHNHIYGMTDLLLEAGGRADAASSPPSPSSPRPSRHGIRRRASLAARTRCWRTSTIALIASAAISRRAGWPGRGDACATARTSSATSPASPRWSSWRRRARSSARPAASTRSATASASRIGPRCAPASWSRQAPIGRSDPDHRPGPAPPAARLRRPAWFFERARYGGILTDIGSHQVDQFLFFTGSTSAEVVASQVANFAHPQYPGARGLRRHAAARRPRHRLRPRRLVHPRRPATAGATAG